MQAVAPEYDNVKRKENWLREYRGDVIRQAESHKWGYWFECLRDGRQIAEANDLGTLMSMLEAGFR